MTCRALTIWEAVFHVRTTTPVIFTWLISLNQNFIKKKKKTKPK